MMEKQNVVHVLSFSRKKEGAETCYTVGEPRKHDATWKKTDTKGHRLYDSIDAKRPRIAESLETEWMDGCQGLGAGKMGVGCIMVLGFLFRAMKTFWN